MATIFTHYVPYHIQKSWHIWKAVSLSSTQASDCATDHEHPLPFPAVFALNPVKHFLRSLIASLRLSVCLSTLLNCVLLNPCQMKTDGLIYPDALPWAFRRAVGAAILTKGVLQSKRGAELNYSRPQDSCVPWEAVDLGIVLAHLIPLLPGKTTTLSARSVTLPSHP